MIQKLCGEHNCKQFSSNFLLVPTFLFGGKRHSHSHIDNSEKGKEPNAVRQPVKYIYYMKFDVFIPNDDHICMNKASKKYFFASIIPILLLLRVCRLGWTFFCTHDIHSHRTDVEITCIHAPNFTYSLAIVSVCTQLAISFERIKTFLFQFVERIQSREWQAGARNFSCNIQRGTLCVVLNRIGKQIIKFTVWLELFYSQLYVAIVDNFSNEYIINLHFRKPKQFHGILFTFTNFSLSLEMSRNSRFHSPSKFKNFISNLGKQAK